MSLRLFAGTCFAIALASAQTGKTPPGALVVHVEPGALNNGIPESFTFKIENTSDHDVILPQPALNCDDAFDGSLILEWKFQPADPDAPGPLGHGCVADTFGAWPPILVRIKEWKTLHAGESLTFEADRAHLLIPDAPGRYEFWAAYAPAYIEDIDKQLLTGGGFDFPKQPMKSASLVYKKHE